MVPWPAWFPGAQASDSCSQRALFNVVLILGRIPGDSVAVGLHEAAVARRFLGNAVAFPWSFGGDSAAFRRAYAPRAPRFGRISVASPWQFREGSMAPWSAGPLR
eukprot:965537-Alexandrium_andersonii.AAC.1